MIETLQHIETASLNSCTDYLQSIDVLCGFREACMHWLERNLSEDHAGQEGGSPATTSGKKKAKGSSVSSPDILAECHKKLSNRWTVDYVTSVCDSDAANSHTYSKSSLRKVSFAPCETIAEEKRMAEEVEIMQRHLSGEVGKDDSVEMPTSSFDREDEGNPAMCNPEDIGQEIVSEDPLARNGESKEDILVNSPQHHKPSSYELCPPCPSPDLTHYKRPSHAGKKTLGEKPSDDYLSYHIKKKLLALQLHEKTSSDKLLTSGHPSSPASSTSSKPKRLGKAKKLSKTHMLDRPKFQSTPDSDASCMTGDESNYYTPKQSLQDFQSAHMPQMKIKPSLDEGVNECYPDVVPAAEDNSDRDSVHSVSSSCSAPSFLISSSSQLCQCIGGRKDSSPNYKQLFDNLASCGRGGKTSSPCPPRDESNGYLSSNDGSEPSLCPKDISSSFISTPVSKISAFSKEISSSSVVTSPESVIHNEDMETAGDTGLSSQCSSRLCAVDESWWKQFESCITTDDSLKPKPENEVVEDSLPPTPKKPVVRKIELDELLSRIYPESSPESTPEVNPELTQDQEDENSDDDLEVVTAESNLDESSEAIDTDDLKDFMDILDSVPDNDEDNLTTYAQKDMSLECSNVSECEEALVNLDIPDEQQPPPHVSIDMPDDMSLAFSCLTPTGAPTQLQGKLSEKFSDAFGEFVYALPAKSSGHDSKEMKLAPVPVTQTEDHTADLISFNEGDKHNEMSNSSKHWPPAPQDWPDLSTSTNHHFSLTEQEDASLLDLRDHTSGRLISGKSTKQDKSLGHCADDSHLSMQKHLSVEIKKRSRKDPDELLNTSGATSYGDSLNSSLNSFTVSSLSLATDILERSHDSLAKSVHDLCQRAIVKQSNISLELCLPSEKLQVDSEGNTSYGSRSFGSPADKSSLINVHLNSSILYSPSDEESSKIV